MEVGLKLRTNPEWESALENGKRGKACSVERVGGAGGAGFGAAVGSCIDSRAGQAGGGGTVVGVAGGWRETHPCPAGANAKHQPTNWRISSSPNLSAIPPTFLPSPIPASSLPSIR